MLRRESEVADDDAQTAEYLYRAGDLHETQIHDAKTAVAQFQAASDQAQALNSFDASARAKD